MDSLTHTVLGACIGQALAGKKIGKQAMLWGAIANNLPDIDVLTSFWMSQAEGLLAHRGFTHSILFALLVSPLLAFLFHRWYRKTTMTFNDWLLIFGTGNFIHIFIDSLTCYGTGWFEPFSHTRVAFNVLFVADPFYTISILISCIALLIISRNNVFRNHWAKIGIVISTCYIFYAIVNKITIDNKTESELTRQHISYNRYFANPTPLNNWLWYLVAQNDSGYFIGYRSLFDRQPNIEFNYYPMHKELIEALPDDGDLKALKRFSQGYYAAEQKADTIYFSDIRFGQLGGWNNSEVPFVFRYTLHEKANNDLVIQRGRMAFSGRDAIRSLIERVKGN